MQLAGKEGRQPQGRGQQNAAEDKHLHQGEPGQVLPHAVNHRMAERRVNHQPDRAVVRPGSNVPVRDHPFADPALGNLPGHKGHQNNIADVQEGGKIHASLPSAGPHQPHQQRREEHSQQTGNGGGADGRGHVPARHGGERYAGLHRGRQHAHVQHAHAQIRPQHAVPQRHAQNAQQGENHEGACSHQALEAPVHQPLPHGAAGKLGPVQEKEQDDGRIAQAAEHRIPHAGTGNQNPRAHADDEADGKAVQFGKESQHGGRKKGECRFRLPT